MVINLWWEGGESEQTEKSEGHVYFKNPEKPGLDRPGCQADGCNHGHGTVTPMWEEWPIGRTCQPHLGEKKA